MAVVIGCMRGLVGALWAILSSLDRDRIWLPHWIFFFFLKLFLIFYFWWLACSHMLARDWNGIQHPYLMQLEGLQLQMDLYITFWISNAKLSRTLRSKILHKIFPSWKEINKACAGPSACCDPTKMREFGLRINQYIFWTCV